MYNFLREGAVCRLGAGDCIGSLDLADVFSMYQKYAI